MDAIAAPAALPPSLRLEPTDVTLLTAGLPGVGGQIKLRNEDFVVEEQPLYPFRGEGDHVYFLVEKNGVDTPGATRLIASALGVPQSAIGYAGLKDAHAVTRQWMSVEHVDAKAVEQLETQQLRVVEVTRHVNKLKVGHLRGNRFTIRVRELGRRPGEGRMLQGGGAAGLRDTELGDAEVRLPASEAVVRAEAVLNVLRRRGVPNYFGPQRFGARHDSHLLGRCVLTQDADRLIRRMLGEPGPYDRGKVLQARQAFERGNLPHALALWPGPFATERRVLAALLQARGDAHRQVQRAMQAIRDAQRGFFISAFQSALFNRVLDDRVRAGDLDQLHVGDVATRHQGGAVFRVLDAAKEQPRCDAMEISPTGPLYGYRSTLADGRAGEVERRVLDEEGLPESSWRLAGSHRVRGDRRALRFPLEEPTVSAGVDEAGPFITLRFTLPKGAYATCVLSEVCKTTAADAEAPPPVMDAAGEDDE